MIFRELHIQSKEGDSRQLVEKLREFTEASSNYESLPEHTARYRQMIGADSYVLLACYKEPLPSIHLASSDGATMHVTNIVPQTKSEMSVEEYNEFLSRFSDELGRYSRKHRLGLRVRLSSDELTLESAVSGPKARERFQRFLAHHPTSYHRCDTLRLDQFIGAVSRQRKARVDTDRLNRYLIEVLGWDAADAKWCVDRVRTGLEVLEAQRVR